MAFILNMNVYALITSSVSGFHFDGVTGQTSRYFSPAMPIFPFLEIIKLNQHFYILNLRIKTLLKTNVKSLPKKEQQKNNS